MKASKFLWFVVLFFVHSSYAQHSEEDQKFWKYGIQGITEFRELLSLPNDAHHPKDIELNVQWSETQFANRGFKTKRLETPTIPLLLAEKKSSIQNAKTVLVYIQLDGQPVDPSFWFQDNPYQAELKQMANEGGWEKIDWAKINDPDPNPDWRIFARSTADAKGPVSMFLKALDIMEDEGIESDFHLKVIMDFEEELGSPQLPEAVVQYKKDLEADMLIIFDGPMHISNEPTLTFGARGIAKITLKVFGPYLPQHSGHYGNYIPNPAVRLSQLISSMKDDEGRVTIPGYYDGIEITDEVSSILKAVPDNEKVINYKMGIAGSDKVAPTYQESLQYPSLNVRGMLAGWVGDEVRTIIPAQATAEIDIRTVIESDPERLIRLVKEHIESQGYLVLDDKPSKEQRALNPKICQFDSSISYQAFRTDFKSDAGLWLEKSLTEAFDKTPIKQRTFGGSIPISPFVNELGIPAVIVPTVNRDNNQHSPNENLRLGNYIDGIKTIYYILKTSL